MIKTKKTKSKSFPRYNDLFVESLRFFRRFTHPLIRSHCWGCFPVTYGMNVGLNKLESLGYRRLKLHDPTFINFDSIPACDRLIDGHTVHI